MLAAKLNEESDELEEEYEEKEEEMEEGKHDKDDMKDMDDENQDESFDIDEILAEMEDGDDEDGGHKKEMGEGKETEDDDDKDDMKDMDDENQDDEDSEEGGDESNLEEEIDLDALIAEMRGEDGEDDKDPDEAYSDDTDEAYGKHDDDTDKMNEDDDPDADMLNKFKKFLKSQRKPEKPKAEEPKKESIELQEIKRQAAELAKKVNETNLINAKLLYLNKVLRDHTLSEQQKLKVVAAFDKASSVKEAKIVYESLNEALKIKTTKGSKNVLKESLGFASKASGTSTKREIISEADQHVARWQKLAGIRK
jgi:hypothetical protein